MLQKLTRGATYFSDNLILGVQGWIDLGADAQYV